jgi:hypothetical protein
MASPPSGPLPGPLYGWVTNTNQPTQAFAQYMAKLDACVRALAGGLFGTPAQLINAANDVAAAAAGVAVGQAYRNGSIMMIRVT